MSHADASRLVLAIDIGATSIKMADVTMSGVVVSAVRRRSTPYPCSPERLTEWLLGRMASRAIPRVGIGFPGDFRDGVVRAPGNLSRVKGRGTPVDPELDSAWRGFPLQERLRDQSGLDVRVVNDAAMAARGCITGTGKELVLTLGTGLGVALAIDGQLTPIPDYGQQLFDDQRTFDAAFGETARALDDRRWSSEVRQVIARFAADYEVAVIHLAGGNSQRLRAREMTPAGSQLSIHGNRAPLLGAARLFADEPPR